MRRDCSRCRRFRKSVAERIAAENKRMQKNDREPEHYSNRDRDPRRVGAVPMLAAAGGSANGMNDVFDMNWR